MNACGVGRRDTDVGCGTIAGGLTPAAVRPSPGFSGTRSGRVTSHQLSQSLHVLGEASNVRFSIACQITAAVEPVEGDFSVLADLDEVAVGITNVAARFPAVIVLWLGKKVRSFVPLLFVAGQDAN